MGNDAPLPAILLVDDDLRLRDLLQRYLESQGFAVRGVDDGVQLQHALDRGHLDLIVLDLMLAGESGSTSAGGCAAEGINPG